MEKTEQDGQHDSLISRLDNEAFLSCVDQLKATIEDLERDNNQREFEIEELVDKLSILRTQHTHEERVSFTDRGSMRSR
jgi:hypothetical protein